MQITTASRLRSPRVAIAGSLLLCSLLSTTTATFGSGAQTGLHVAACTQGKHRSPAECGTFGTYEDRAARSGRVIELGVVVLKARHPSRDAIAFLEGGPGSAALPDAPYIADGDDPVLAAFKDDEDVVFVDSRGMGSSNPTNCNISPYDDMPAYFKQTWPDGILKRCYQRYAATSDPNAYNTNNAVDDLDDVRAALGYRKLLLYGGSYATFFSFVYMRRHPEHVKSAVLEGVIAPHFVSLPGAPEAAQNALDDLVKKCRLDAVCRSAFPHFIEHFQAVLRRFTYEPVPMEVENPKTKRPQSVELSKQVLVDRIRENLYAPETAAYLPYIIERAYHFDYVPLGKLIDFWSQLLAHGQDAGTNLAYRCADLDPFISEADVQAQAEASFTGDLRVRAERQACAIWKVAPMPAEFNDPVRTSVPVLMFDGSDDPVTPPKYALGAMHYLTNAKLVLVRGAGHGVDTPCTTHLMIAFIRSGSLKDVNASSCTAAFKPPPFATSMAGWDS